MLALQRVYDDLARRHCAGGGGAPPRRRSGLTMVEAAEPRQPSRWFAGLFGGEWRRRWHAGAGRAVRWGQARDWGGGVGGLG